LLATVRTSAQTLQLPGTAKEKTMKLCRYDDDRLGVVRGDAVHDVTEAQTEIRKSSPYAMKGDAVVAALPGWRERIERLADKAPGKPIAHVKLLAPVARPTKLSCAPTNYQAHIEEMRNASQQPGSQIVSAQSSKILEAGMFLKANSALVGPSEGIPIRFPDRRNDHEVELVMVIGKAGSEIPQAKALDYVAGFCLGLDMTVRGREDRSFRKSVDGYAVLGPWMATADEVPDPDSIPISIEVNGEVRQKSNTSQLIYNCRRLIEFASEFYTLYPGDLVYTGTPEGVSPVKPGDVIVCRSSPVLGELKIAVRAHELGSVESDRRVRAQA
jgi:2,4-diketo-3-deoxy-L-fuconate hydrolase